ncbi:MAG: queuosine salvage family protein [Microscillaceae bacterium]|nr:queuosine salvage family protein [Microscillaceae bacterium]
MEKTFKNKLREAARKVMSLATFVKINENYLEEYLQSLDVNKIKHPELSAENHFFGQEEAMLRFYIILDSINFGSGYFPHLNKLPGYSGYFTVATHLTNECLKHGVPQAEDLIKLTQEDCTRIFQQDPGNEVIQELMQLFAQALQDLGHFITQRYQGDFKALIEDAGKSAVKLVQILTNMPLFKDIQPYKGFEMPFYKRAQLTAADLSLVFKNQGFGQFDDLDQLTIFADNLVPHVLHADGILLYRRSLIEQILAEELLMPNSEMEVEIRAGGLLAVEMMEDAFARKSEPISALELDYLFWNRGQEKYYKARPRHRARTSFY